MKNRPAISFLFLCIDLVFLAASPAFCLADDTLVAESGHNVYPISTDHIRMVSEKVTLKRDGRTGGVLVDCIFVFENLSDSTIKAKVGFPGHTFFSEMETRDRIYDFEAIAGGEARQVEVRKEVLEKYSEGETEYRYWYTWDEIFPPGKKVEIKNTYSLDLSEDMDSRWFSYVLVTGSNWKGRIGKALIEVVYENEETLRSTLKSIEPEGYSIEGNRVVWEFTDLVPKEDIRVTEVNLRFKDLFINDAIRFAILKTPYIGDKSKYTELEIELRKNRWGWERLASYASGYAGMFTGNAKFMEEGRKAYARARRNEIFARHGRAFNSPEMRDIFEKTDWYRVDPGYSDDMLNEIEKKNVQFILGYEKKMGWR